ncbi:MAG: hypothetical protein JWQ97_2994 [Phenylobacterium sp.]|nr:hypothetical protein [Phenylobacterium sp.]
MATPPLKLSSSMRVRPFRLQPILACIGFLVGSSVADAARADTYSLSISNAMDLGQVTAAASGTTTFRVSPQSGQVNLLSGAGHRLGTGLVRVTVTVRCANDNNKLDNGDHDQGGGNNKLDCNANKVGVIVGPVGLTTGRALPLSAFAVSMSSASLAGAVTTGAFTSFLLNPIGNDQSRTFYVGADFPVAGDESGKASGTGLAPFFVNLTDASGDLITYTLGVGSITAYRALTIAKSADLRFGAVIRPASGSGAVSIDPASDARTTSGGVAGLPGQAYGAASFTITGEGGQAFSVSVPSTIQLAGPTNLNVHTTTNLPTTPMLGGAAGSAGSFTLKVGGSIPVASGALVGAYSGVWTATVDYN